MKRFRYRLDPVLKLKAHREKLRQREHALALQQVLSQRARLGEIEAEKLKTLDQERNFLIGPLRPQLLMTATRYLVKLRRDTILGRELLHGLETEAEKRRQRLVEAARERKTYDKHKERMQKRYVESLEAREAKQLDELAIIRFNYRSKS